MQTLKSLVANKSDVWIFCKNEYLQKHFLWQAENEGFLALNGQNPSALNHHQLYAITNDMKVGYLSAMIWALTKKAGNTKNAPTRIDYEKYLACENDHLYYGRLDQKKPD